MQRRNPLRFILIFSFITYFILGDALSQEVAIIHYHRCDGAYGDYDSNDFNDFWGLHLWTGALNPTEWMSPLKPIAADDFGMIFEIPLIDLAEGLNFIMHRGDAKDLNNDQYLDFSVAGQEVWIVSGDDAVSENFIQYPSFAEASFSTQYCGPPYVVTIHYFRCDGDYGDYTSNDYNNFWGLHAFEDVVDPVNWTEPIKAISEGPDRVMFEVPVIASAQMLGFIIHRGDNKDPGPDEFLDILNTGDEIWVTSGDTEAGVHVQHTSFTDAINSPRYCGPLSVATIHYHRCEGDYGNYNSFDYNNYWGLHLWTGAVYETDWLFPMKPTSSDEFGQVFEIPVVEMATSLNYIIHKGDLLDQGPDESLDLINTGNQIWLVSEDVDQGSKIQYGSFEEASNSSFFCRIVIPTLSQWGIIVLGMLMLIFGVVWSVQNRHLLKMPKG
jgi:pullulanase